MRRLAGPLFDWTNPKLTHRKPTFQLGNAPLIVRFLINHSNKRYRLLAGAESERLCEGSAVVRANELHGVARRRQQGAHGKHVRAV
jgi:hypothetical protein